MLLKEAQQHLTRISSTSGILSSISPKNFSFASSDLGHKIRPYAIFRFLIMLKNTQKKVPNLHCIILLLILLYNIKVADLKTIKNQSRKFHEPTPSLTNSKRM